MKNFIITFLFIMFLQVSFGQPRLNLSISKATELIGSKTEDIESYLSKNDYRFAEKSNNFYSYIKVDNGIGYSLTVAIRNGKVTALSWDELSVKSTFRKNEVENLGLKLTTNTTMNDKIIRSYQSITRNLMITLILDNSNLKITLGLKDSNKPYFLPKTVFTSSESAGYRITSKQAVKYSVIVNKAYFYNQPVNNTKRKAYLAIDDIVEQVNEKNGFIYVEFTNKKSGKFSKGWIKKECLNQIK